MTTLNFSKYFANLVRHGFLDSLIIKEKLSYKYCFENLGKIKYNEFRSKYTDLDDFEKIACDFSNYYRWTGGQETIDGIRIKSINFNSLNSATVIIEYCDHNTENHKIIFWGSNAVAMIKRNDNWKIGNINWN